MSIIYINSYQFAAAPPSGYDPDAAAYIARVEGVSGDNQPLETAVKDAINAFVVGCKADGIWSAISASCILAGARTLAGALQPLVGPSPTNVNGNFVQADYNRKNGIAGNGTNKALLTNIKINDLAQDNCHMSLYATTHAGTYAMGTLNASVTGAFHIVDGRDRVRSATITGINIIARDNPSMRAVSRSSPTSVNSLLNAIVTPYSSTSQVAQANWDIAVFGTASTSGTISSYNASVISFYSLGSALDLGLLRLRVVALMAAFAAAIP